MQVFLDCDGVLADFDTRFVELFGVTSKEYEDAYGSKMFWLKIKTAKPSFFENLPLMPDAIDLYEGVVDLGFRPIILTGCPYGEWSEIQKIKWGRKYFPGVPLVVCKSRDKRDYCQTGDVLIDDITKYKLLWEEAGGHYIVHTSAKQSLADLKEYMENRNDG